MALKKMIGKLFGVFNRIRLWAESEEQIYGEILEEDIEKRIYSVWDFLSFSENTQAFHLINVIGFEEWIDMEEIRRRVNEIFSAEYKNEKSLYPYLKTLADINLFESSNIGGRRKWRKKELLFEVEMEREKKGEKKAERKEVVVKLKAREKK